MNASTSTSVLVRRDQANQPAIFLLDTLNTKSETIEVWGGDDQPPREVSLTYYKNSRPTTDADEEALVTKFRQKFNPPAGIILRRRLFKVSPSAGGSEVLPTTSFVEKAHAAFVDSAENKAAQQRESSPEAAKEAAKKETTNAQGGLQQLEKLALAERITSVYAAHFAKAIQEAYKEAMK